MKILSREERNRESTNTDNRSSGQALKRGYSSRHEKTNNFQAFGHALQNLPGLKTIAIKEISLEKK
uniref:Uncharacterized protein n=1 Tax=Glossina morsitans morsitans TaxID=37546 RepID=A0A1B0FAK9_GLOMM